MTCSHPILSRVAATLNVWIADTHGDDLNRTVPMVWQFCAACREVLSLGAANDGGLEVEIRAAAMAACLFDAMETVNAGGFDCCDCFEREQELSGVEEATARWLSDVIHDRDAKWDEPIGDLIERSSIGAGLRNIRENGVDAELADLEREMSPRRRR